MKSNCEYLLEMKGITKIFPGVKALDNVNFKVRKGTVHALLGENGAGKSTLMKILAGEHIADAGEIIYHGNKVEIHNTKDALDMGISMIYQELNLVNQLDIAQNIFLGREPSDRIKSFINDKEIYSLVSKYLQDMGLKYNPKTKVADISVSDGQMIEIVKGISRGASLIVMDEPTSAIADSEIEKLFDQIRDLKEKGITFVYISHKLDEIFKICDEITVLRDGQWVGTTTTESVNEKKLVSMMVGRELTELFPKAIVERGDIAFEVKNLTKEGLFRDISFHVRKGEILGISGLMGAGRTEIAEAIFGLKPADSGEIILDGEVQKIKSPGDAIKNGVIMVPEDRKQVGLVLIRSVLENISLANLDKFTKKFFIDTTQEKKDCQEMAKNLSVKASNLNVSVKTLSGGNQQKVVLSKWLMCNIKVLILDEPTRGIDVGAKSEIYKLMNEFVKQGMAVIMISSELPEVLGMSDRIMVIREGIKMGELDRDEATQERIMTLATGGRNQ